MTTAPAETTGSTLHPNAIGDRDLWLQSVFACRLSDLDKPIRPITIKAVASRLAISADDSGCGALPEPALLASEFETTMFDAIGALTTLRQLGFLAWGSGCFLEGSDMVPAETYQLTVRQDIFQDPIFRDFPGVLSDAETIGRKFVELFKADPGACDDCALYRWYDIADHLLYVGTTKDLAARSASHGKGSSWAAFAARCTVEFFNSRDEAEQAEVAAIRRERPLFNSQHNNTPEARQRLVAYLVEHDRLDLLQPAVSRG